MLLLNLCQVFAMKLNVCKEINSMILNDKTIASLQPNVSPAPYNFGLQADRLTLKTVPPHISKTHIAIHLNLRHFWPSIPSFAFGVLFKYSFTELKCYFKILQEGLNGGT